MDAVLHKDYIKEDARLKDTVKCIGDSLIIFSKVEQELEEKYKEILRYYDPRNNPQSVSDMILNENMRKMTKLKLRNLKDAIYKPYFARVDFKEDNLKDIEKLYIGKVSLESPSNHRQVIIDWRAPISNLYYEGKVGKEGFIAPDGKITGDLLLKRQFEIQDGCLKDITDTDIVSNDELLKHTLQSNTADSKLKDIVATIQLDQNRIIREKISTSLLVQGSAGSGKTTIALHRIAYLIYTYNKTFKPEDFIIIGPNKLFLNYISDVLPELGVEEVKQTTMDGLFKELVNCKCTVKNKNEKLISIISEKADIDKDSMIVASKLKASLVFKDALEVYLGQFENYLIPDKDLTFQSHLIITKEEAKSIFKGESTDISLYDRVNRLKKNIVLKIENQSRRIIDLLDQQCENQINEIKSNISDPAKRQQEIINAIDKKNEIINNIKYKSKAIVDDYLNIKELTPIDVYKNFINSGKLNNYLLEHNHSAELVEYMKKSTLENLNKKTIEVEDTAPIMYIQYKVNGVKNGIKAKHIIIDEAQDLSPFQFYVLKQLSKDSSFTILGDICQGICSYSGTNDWAVIQDKVFKNIDCKRVVLDKSYRTTIEIMNAANTVISKMDNKNLPKSVPIIRQGEKVEVIKEKSPVNISKDIIQKISSLKEKDYKSIAVICKTPNECSKIHSMLKKFDPNIQLISDRQEQYNGGIVIIPSYQSKGLEFDAVIIPDASSKNYSKNDIDAKLLYVSMTRSLHKLYIYYHGEPSELLESINGSQIHD